MDHPLITLIKYSLDSFGVHKAVYYPPREKKLSQNIVLRNMPKAFGISTSKIKAYGKFLPIDQMQIC